MNALHVVTVATFVSATLYALPAFAQQGPAGVPGVVELLVESVTPVIADEPAAPPPSVRPESPPAAAMPTENGVKRLPTVQKPANKTSRVARKLRKPVPEDCSKTSDPARCQLFQKARKTCQPQLGGAHRQCLRDVLTAGQ